MKILMHSHVYLPSIGGIERVASSLAKSWHDMGHEVVVTTTTSGADRLNLPYPVYINPNVTLMGKLIRQADVYFQSNISLRQIFPWLASGTPLFVGVAIWMDHGAQKSPFIAKLKRWFLACPRVYPIAVSRAVAEPLPAKTMVIPNAYRDELFGCRPHIERNKDFVFLGRLVSDKGLDLLLEACHIIKTTGKSFSLTVIGHGVELESAAAFVREHGLEESVTFEGVLDGEKLVDELNRHRVMVVPSKWREPFGVVALEGLACGCVPLVSDGDGLAEAVGSCGWQFKKNDVHDLAKAMLAFLEKGASASLDSSKIFDHLKKHHSNVIAQRYIDAFRSNSTGR